MALLYVLRSLLLTFRCPYRENKVVGIGNRHKYSSSACSIVYFIQLDLPHHVATRWRPSVVPPSPFISRIVQYKITRGHIMKVNRVDGCDMACIHKWVGNEPVDSLFVLFSSDANQIPTIPSEPCLGVKLMLARRSVGRNPS